MDPLPKDDNLHALWVLKVGKTAFLHVSDLENFRGTWSSKIVLSFKILVCFKRNVSCLFLSHLYLICQNTLFYEVFVVQKSMWALLEVSCVIVKVKDPVGSEDCIVWGIPASPSCPAVLPTFTFLPAHWPPVLEILQFLFPVTSMFFPRWPILLILMINFND